MSYFKSFPIRQYDIEKNGNTKTVTDLLKRVGIRGNMNELARGYYKVSNNTDSRPDLLSHQIYDDVDRYWILLMINNVVDPHYDWLMNYNVLEEVINRMYPDKNLLLYADHFQQSTIVLDGRTFLINDYNTAGPTFFISGEKIIGSPSGAEGTVVKFDSTIKQVIYKQISGTFVDADLITGQDSGAVGKIESATIEREGVHHYESSAPEESEFIVDRDYHVAYGTTHYYSTTVTNSEYMENFNESKRDITTLRSQYLIQFENEFKDKIGG